MTRPAPYDEPEELPAALAELRSPMVIDPTSVWLPTPVHAMVAYADQVAGWVCRRVMYQDLERAERAAIQRQRLYEEPTAGTCRSCGAPILWMALVSADPSKEPRPHPVDVQTEKRAVRFGRSGRRIKIVDTYTSHFASCPNAASHRTRGQ